MLRFWDLTAIKISLFLLVLIAGVGRSMPLYPTRQGELPCSRGRNCGIQADAILEAKE
jgi:hypothetical protein